MLVHLKNYDKKNVIFHEEVCFSKIHNLSCQGVKDYKRNKKKSEKYNNNNFMFSNLIELFVRNYKCSYFPFVNFQYLCLGQICLKTICHIVKAVCC